MSMRTRWLRSLLVIAGLTYGSVAPAAELLVGGATVSITPEKAVALEGQLYPRIAEKVASPVTATALALESRDGGKSIDQAILVSCDLVAVRSDVLQAVQVKV